MPPLSEQIAAQRCTVVVLDDDPTGTQTAHGVPVLTRWDVDTIAAELAAGPPALYLLTNSRSLDPTRAADINVRTGRQVRAAAEVARRRVVVVSRGDSTLRGHFPDETQALAEGLGGGFDGVLLVPAFLEAGRVTVDGRHWVADAGGWMPVGRTPYARDATFGFTSSDLPDWVAERSGGRIPRQDVQVLTAWELRRGGPAAVAGRLRRLRDGAVCACDVAHPADLEVLVAGVLAAEAAGARLLYRTAASFVRVRAGLPPRGLLTVAELGLRRPADAGGLVVVGSHVPATTAQLDRLLADLSVIGIHVDAARLAGSEQQVRAEVDRVAELAGDAVAAGCTAVVHTSRTVLTAPSAALALARSVRVSAGLVQIVGRIPVRPAFVVAKGGITSSDVAADGLGISRADVLGQVLPGVPVWRAGADSRFPGLTYVVFPGNVGGPDDLLAVVKMLDGSGGQEGADDCTAE
ncbi:four-carbon acid sugar kinase family protein [Micromonospora coxensis]|uniref:four-carbon acid sugar kinase family protein n=1 Tax=Micromonospora coxensis TaxID=356852 RepID=UPI0015603848|nr:four-carbon acid sugar kinase family protein [Micromonospora coxensis]